MEVIAAYQQVGSYRGAAAMCGTTHKTVKRIVEAAREGEVGGQRRSSARCRNYDSVAVLVADKVAQTAGRISAKRLLPAARAAGYDGSPRNFHAWSPTPRTTGGAGSPPAAGRGCGHPARRC